MKFRNHETGEVLRYRDIIPVLCKSGCDNCPIIAEVLKHDDQSCQAWILNHPHEAARLMGYEVIEDEKEDANMDKPRICKVLGVEVGEDVKYRHTDGTEENICVCEDGRVIISSFSCKISTVAVLINAINHPDRIIRKPHWTEQEVERAKAIKVLLPEINAIKCNGALTQFLEIVDGTYFQREVITRYLFPSVEKGHVYTLDEIIGGAQ